jgi:hypothetical protein
MGGDCHTSLAMTGGWQTGSGVVPGGGRDDRKGECSARATTEITRIHIFIKGRTIMKRAIVIILCLTLVWATAVMGDEITDRLKNGTDLYNQQKYSDAIAEINYALQLIHQKQADELVKYFPEAPSGWTASTAETGAATAAFMGGMTSASREYNHSSGGWVEITMSMDSPMLSSILMFLSNPMMAMGKRIETIAGEKAIIEYDEDGKSGDINMAIANKLLLTVDGNDVTLDQLKGFVNAMDLGKLKAFIGG